MKLITSLAMGALLATAAACTGLPDEPSSSLSYPLVMCSPIDPQCELTQPLDRPPVPDVLPDP